MINETQIFFLAAIAANVGNQTKQVTNTVEGSRGDHDVNPGVCERFKQKQAFRFVQYFVECINDDEAFVKFSDLSAKNPCKLFKRWEDLRFRIIFIQLVKFFTDI